MFAKVYLEITNVCNMNCSFCVGTKRKKHFMTEDEFTLLAAKIRPHTDFLYFHLMGEPLLHPKLRKLLEISQELGFKVIITTNGSLLSEVGHALLESKALFKVSISLHSFEANLTSDGENYFNNCFDFADKASSQGIITVLRLWNDGGLDSMNEDIYAMLKKRFTGEWAENTKGIRIRKKLFIEKGEKFDWPLQSETYSDNIFCYGMKDHIGVLCDGSVVPCCMDYDGNITLGNMFEQDLSDILNSERAIFIKKSLESGTAPCEMCKRCGFAQKKFLHI